MSERPHGELVKAAETLRLAQADFAEAARKHSGLILNPNTDAGKMGEVADTIAALERKAALQT